MITKLLLTITIIICAAASQAQWQPDVRLTNNPGSSNTTDDNARCIAVSGNIVHVVWRDNRDGNYEIYYKRSQNGGLSWDADTRLTNNSYFSTSPSVSVSGAVVHVVWTDNRDGNDEIYYKRSQNGGLSWGPDTYLTNSTFVSRFPSISVSGAIVHVVWKELRSGNYEIYYKRSQNGGLSWDADTALTNNLSASEFPSVSVSGAVVHVVWHDNRDGNTEIYYKSSQNAGLYWGTDTRLTNNSARSEFPSVSVSGAVVHVVWTEYRDGNQEIYYKHSVNGGLYWGADTRLTNDPAVSWFPCVSVTGAVVHVVWSDLRNGSGNYEIYYKRSLNGGLGWEADTRLTYNSASSVYTTVSVSGVAVHVVWQDNRDGNTEIYYKRNPTGFPLVYTFTRNNVNKPIPDFTNTYDTLFTFHGMDMSSFYVNDISLTIDTVLHTRDSDLEISLIHQSVTDTVIYQVGGTGANFIGTVLDDSASTPIGNGTAPFTGTFRPTKPLSQFINTNPAGAWILRIYDRATGNTGMLTAWSLTLTVSESMAGISQINTEIPEDFKLYQNYPNPFNPETKIRFEIPGGNNSYNQDIVKLTVFDLLGREVALLVNSKLQPGTYEYTFDGSKLSSGIYLYTLKKQSVSYTKKMLLIK